MEGATIKPLSQKNFRKVEGLAFLQNTQQKYRPWLGILTLIIFALLYSFSALSSPFWNGNDTWSNLLPIIHFRQSILTEDTLPLYTDLWYGGRNQWANPLWNFLYLPSTLIWLVTPLDWGTRIVFLAHLIFSLLAGRILAGLFLKSEIEKFSAAIIFTAPMLPALTAGHVEKILSWGWVLLALYFLLSSKLTSIHRGLGSGICLGIVPLTGANYYAFYAGILLLPLVISYRDIKLFSFFCLGSLTGLLHLPSVWQLMGQTRNHAKDYIKVHSVNLLNIISTLSIGFAHPFGWENWSPVGITTFYLFGLTTARKMRRTFTKMKYALSNQEIALLVSILLLSVLASGVAYYGHNWLDLFRIPSRALAFAALGIALFVFMNARTAIELGVVRQKFWNLFLFIAAIQIVLSIWVFRPRGSIHSPYEESVQHLANVLKANHAKSVWVSTEDLNDMYIHVGLTQNNLALPNVYYGDMGQDIEALGTYCGYSFDHLIAFAPVEGSALELFSATKWSDVNEQISLNKLLLLEQVKLDDKMVNVYRVVCNQ
jgi:hypothetical protein